MKLFTLIFTSALLTVALADTPLKTVSEKALAAQKEALAIEGMLKSKQPDLAVATARAEALHQHVLEMHTAAMAVETPGSEQMKASVDVLKVLTENKAKQIATATNGGERERFRATAKNIASRAEQILKSTRKIGG